MPKNWAYEPPLFSDSAKEELKEVQRLCKKRNDAKLKTIVSDKEYAERLRLGLPMDELIPLSHWKRYGRLITAKPLRAAKKDSQTK